MDLRETHVFLDKHEWVRYGKHRIKRLPHEEHEHARQMAERYGKDGIQICKGCGYIRVIPNRWNNMSAMQNLAAAMGRPLKQHLDYQSIAKSLLKIERIDE